MVMSIMKKSKDQRGDNVILVIASGYVTKARPDPALTTSSISSPSSVAMNPKMLKITKPAKIELLPFEIAIMIASLKD